MMDRKNACYRCGENFSPGHSDHCPAKNALCWQCGRPNHFARRCLKPGVVASRRSTALRTAGGLRRVGRLERRPVGVSSRRQATAGTDGGVDSRRGGARKRRSSGSPPSPRKIGSRPPGTANQPPPRLPSIPPHTLASFFPAPGSLPLGGMPRPVDGGLLGIPPALAHLLMPPSALVSPGRAGGLPFPHLPSPPPPHLGDSPSQALRAAAAGGMPQLPPALAALVGLGPALPAPPRRTSPPQPRRATPPPPRHATPPPPRRATPPPQRRATSPPSLRRATPPQPRRVTPPPQRRATSPPPLRRATPPPPLRRATAPQPRRATPPLGSGEGAAGGRGASQSLLPPGYTDRPEKIRYEQYHRAPRDEAEVEPRQGHVTERDDINDSSYLHEQERRDSRHDSRHEPRNDSRHDSSRDYRAREYDNYYQDTARDLDPEAAELDRRRRHDYKRETTEYQGQGRYSRDRGDDRDTGEGRAEVKDYQGSGRAAGVSASQAQLDYDAAYGHQSSSADARQVESEYERYYRRAQQSQRYASDAYRDAPEEKTRNGVYHPTGSRDHDDGGGYRGEAGRGEGRDEGHRAGGGREEERGRRLESPERRRGREANDAGGRDGERDGELVGEGRARRSPVDQSPEDYHQYSPPKPRPRPAHHESSRARWAPEAANARLSNFEDQYVSY